jgi:hypothetical protein
VVLTWGSEPADLDAHLSGPICGTTERFHVYYGKKQPVAYAEMDEDDSDGEGPETMAIWAYDDQWVPGEYDFWVDNYDLRYVLWPKHFGESNAVVTVLKEGEQVDQFAVADEQDVETTTLGTWRVVNLIIVDEEGTLELNRVGQGFEEATEDSAVILDPLVLTDPPPVPCPPLPGVSSQPSSAATASGGNHGSDPLAAALAVAAVVPMLAVIPVSRLRRRR